MADEAAPVAAEPAAAPVAEGAPAAVETPVVADAPAVEAPAAEPAVTAPETTELPAPLIGGEEPAAETPAETTEAPATDAPAVAERIPLSFEKFKAPQGFDFTDQAHTEYSALLNELGLDGITQEIGQKLLDRHAAEVTRIVEAERKRQHSVFGDTIKSWQQQMKSDPVIGGAQYESSVAAANQMVQKYGGNDKERAELRAALRFTGMGNHISMARLLNNLARALAPPKIVAAAPTAPKSAPNTVQGKAELLYGGKAIG